MVLGILDSHIKKNENRPHFIHYTKINSNGLKTNLKQTNKKKRKPSREKPKR